MNKKPIKQIKLSNFQSHKDTVLDLSEGVNVIVGPSDVGKTAILRALRWVFFNEPRGDYFIRHGFNESSVELVYEGDTIVRRKRASNFNGYEIERDGIVEKYSGMGSSVPKEVIDITGVKKFEIEEGKETAVNFQTQLEGAFLLADTPIQKAKSIGAISNVNSIDEAIKRSIKKDRDNKNKIKLLESDIENLDKKIDSFSYLETLKEDLKQTKQLYKSIEESVQKLTNLKNNQIKLSKVLEQIKILEHQKEIQDKILSIKNIYDDLSFVLTKGDHLYQLFSRYKNCQKSIQLQEDYLLQQPDIEKLKLILNQSEKEIEKYIHLDNGKNKLCQLNIQIRNNKEIKNRAEAILQLKNIGEEVQDIATSIDLLNNLNNKFMNMTQDITAMNVVIQKNNYTNLVEPINEIIKANERYTLKNKQLTELKEINQKIDVTKNKVNYLVSLINDETNKYIDFIKLAKKCPLCGSEMTEDHINKLKEELYHEVS